MLLNNTVFVIDDIKYYTEEAKEKLKNISRQNSLNDFFTPNY